MSPLSAFLKSVTLSLVLELLCTLKCYVVIVKLVILTSQFFSLFVCLFWFYFCCLYFYLFFIFLLFSFVEQSPSFLMVRVGYFKSGGVLATDIKRSVL